MNNKQLALYTLGAALIITVICTGIQWAYRQSALTYNSFYVFLILTVSYVLFGIVLGIKDFVIDVKQPGNWSLQPVGLSIFMVLITIYVLLIFFPVYIFSSVDTMVNSVFKSDYFIHAWGTLTGYIGMTNIIKKDLASAHGITSEVSGRLQGND